MPVLTRTEQELINDGVTALLETTPVTAVQRGSTARALLEISANQVANLHRKIDQTRQDMFLSTAQGDALDRIGELLGVKRGVALRAFDDTDNVKFYIDPSLGETAAAAVQGRISDATIDANPDSLSPTGFTIKTGITLTAGSGISYTTTGSIVFSGTDTEGFTGVIANGVGPAYNIQAGQLNKHNLDVTHSEFGTLADFILVENTMPIQTGSFAESDEAYRFRIQNALATLQAGNQSSIISAALSVPGVRDATYIPYSSGLSSFTVIITSSIPLVSEGLKNAAQAAVDSVTSAGVRGSVIGPKYYGVEIKVALEYRPRADRLNIRHKVRRAGVQYINGIPIGEPLILNELIQRILDVDDLILDLHFDKYGYGAFNTRNLILYYFQPVAPPSNIYHRSKWAMWYTSDALFTVCDG